ncbi:hydrogenase maturation factor HybG [Serratia sp. L9]|uniref:hydrogenase maturation factor HybG n=1 Tax=Serratia sp. L9 TaxID=3423946 RepID=UPI003D67EC07
MCLGVPGKVTAVGEDIHQLAWADVCGVAVKINIALICEGSPQELIGQWVLVHVGFAMSILDEQEALETLAALEHMRAVGLERHDEDADALR